MIIRPATTGDTDALAAIYGHHAREGLGTFEEEAPNAKEMARRLGDILAHGLPYLVAEEAGTVLGFAYAAPFRLRSAYRFTVEDSVYIAPGAQRRGVGKALLKDLIARCEALGLRQMIAVIGDSGNAGSIGLHAALSFDHAGIGRSLGFKHGRWVDIVWMQRALNRGDSEPPDLTRA